MDDKTLATPVGEEVNVLYEPPHASVRKTERYPISRRLVMMAWGVMLVASILPNVLWNELTGGSSGWMDWPRLALLGGLCLAAFFWKTLHPLRNYLAVLLVYGLANEVRPLLNFNLPFVQDLLGSSRFVASMQPEQFGKFVIALAIILALVILGYRRAQMYLTPGKLDAPITPVPWMGFPKPDPWWKFGGQYGLYIALTMGLVTWWLTRTPLASLVKVIPILPAILLFAMMNAFFEEMSLRASLLCTLEGPIGIRQAWWLAAVLFGISHFYGVPAGWLGMLLAGFNGWLLGKAMVETRGMFWAWWMHFLQDVAIFTFIAAGTLLPGA